MTEKEKQTEDLIAEAAREVFIEKGMAGARMQEIADKAGINKSLLHYYFRSKDKLFNFVFDKIIKQIGSRLNSIIFDGEGVENKVRAFVDLYTNLLLKNPFLPNFVLGELSKNPDGLLDRFLDAKISVKDFIAPMRDSLIKEGYNIHPHDFVINTLSMVIFPVAAKPLITKLLFEGDKKAYKEYIISRKESIVVYVMNALEGYRIKK